MLSPRSLFLASPLYGNTLHFGYHQSVCSLIRLCAERGIHLGIKHIGCDSLVPRARNLLVYHHFLSSPCTDFMFIDADIKFDPEDVLGMLASDLPILGGVYPRKQLDWHRIRRAALAGVPADSLARHGFIPVMNYQSAGDFPLDRPFPVRHLGTGFLRVRRHVFESMIATLGDAIAFDHSSEQSHLSGTVGRELFPIGPDVRYPVGSGGRQYLSEDWAFCELARQCGFIPHADPRIKLIHSGYYDYCGDMSVLDASLDADSTEER